MSVPEYRTLSFKVNAEGVNLKTAQLNDQEHLVVPVVALVEGVLHPANAEGPELALASEFGRFPDGWNGRPVILGHPKNSEGKAVTANSPDLYNSSVVGHMFNAKISKKRLKAEMWINTKKAGKDLLKRFKEDVVEVSTGLYAQSEETNGKYEGKTYESIWRNIVPDHLAILSEGTLGACSIEDGCGAPRLNQDIGDTTMLKDNCSCDAKTETRVLDKFFKSLTGWFKSKTDIKDLELTDMDRRVALEAALKVASPEEYAYVMAVYNNHFVYMCYKRDGGGSHVYDRGYSIVEGGAITLSQDVVEVRAETDYVPLVVKANESDQQGDIDMTPEQKQQAEKDKTTLETLTASATKARAVLKEAKIECEGMSDIEVVVAAGIAEQKATDTKALADKEAKDAADKAEAEEKAKHNESQKSILDFIGSAPSRFKADLEHALSYTNERKSALVKALVGKTDFTKDELTAMEPVALEKIAKALKANTDDVLYAGNTPAGLPKGNAGDADKGYTPMSEAFPRKAA